MTGKLALLGVVLVLFTSLFAGLVNSSPTDEPVHEDVMATVVPEDSEGDDEAGEGEEADTPENGEQAPEAQPAEPAPPVTNRENCSEIRGTDYFSPEERTWFLTNCVNN